MQQKNKAFRIWTAVVAASLLAFPLAGACTQPTYEANASQTQTVIVSGQPFGIKLFTDGVVVVGTADIPSSGGAVNPARQADIQIGDLITAVNDTPISSNNAIAQAVEQSGGKAVSLTLQRSGKTIQAKLQPVASAGGWRAGLWVRDSAAGVGTLTFYDPQTGMFGGLGHGVTDPDTTDLVPFGSGDIVPVSIHGYQKGTSGTPGELRGYFTSDTPVGTLMANVGEGVYGSMQMDPGGKRMAVCPAEQVKPGKAQVLCTIDGTEPETYDAEIVLVDTRSTQSRNLVLRITDQRLLDKTGGIVQGMSGSPILQNGQLVGAITHVFVNDPTRGYGILAAHMLSTETQLAQKRAG